MTDEELIGYCELHCRTSRALFSGIQLNRMIELAGFPENWLADIPDDVGIWVSVHEEMLELCELAKKRLKTNPASTT